MTYFIDEKEFKKQVKRGSIATDLSTVIFAIIFLLSLLPLLLPQVRWVAAELWAKFFYGGFVAWHLVAAVGLQAVKERYKSFMNASFAMDKDKRVSIQDGFIHIDTKDDPRISIPLNQVKVHHYTFTNYLRISLRHKGFVKILYKGRTYYLSSLLFHLSVGNITLRRLFKECSDYKRIRLNIWKKYDWQVIYNEERL